MSRVKRTYLITAFLIGSISVNAQLLTDVCVQEILKLENKISQGYSNSEKTIYMNYKVQSTDWEGKLISSNVKIYKNKRKMNFFSDQANMYQDEKNAVIVLKPQRVIIVNGAVKDVPSNDMDQLLVVRKKFLKSCEVLKCEQSASNKNIKTLEVKSTLKLGGKLKIDRMVYTYNTLTGKILKCVTYYDKGFQVKKIVIEYQKLDFNSDYKFTKSAKKQVLGKYEKLLTAYKGYELVDNTKDN